MKIKRLSFTDHARGITIEPIEFNDGMNLLVGASGSGKTQILKALMTLKEIAWGVTYSGVQWELELEGKSDSGQNTSITWSGLFETKGTGAYPTTYPVAQEPDFPDIKEEKIIVDGIILLDRKASQIKYNNVLINIKFRSEISAFSLLREEKDIKNILDEVSLLELISFSNFYDSRLAYILSLETKYIRNADMFLNASEDDYYIEKLLSSNSINSQLYILYLRKPDIFNAIVKAFIDIFPQVEDIKYDYSDYKNGERKKEESKNLKFRHKSKGGEEWVSPNEMSSGMLHVLFLITRLHLAKEGSVILIDEFENSLGVNCIDIITDLIVDSDRDLQFIITSHHPYIINNIPFEAWKVITRNGGIIKSKNASEYPQLGRSRHEHFMQLIQIEEFRTGVAQ